MRVLLAVVALGLAMGLSAPMAGQSGASPSTSDTEWRFYGGDAGATRYSPVDQIFVVMPSYMLVALDAKTGRQVPGFGNGGVLDLAANLRWAERPGLPREGRVSNTSPVSIVGNVLVAPISMHTGSTPNLPGASVNEQWPMNVPGDVVGYDTRTGKMLWRFNTIPRPGEEGAETWLKADPKVWEVPGGLNAWAKERPQLRERSNLYTGNAGFWAPATADPELGLFYIPTESSTSDYYGGYRPGDNLYANSIVALDAKTGRRVWHFQTTHHDLWDFDPPTAPILVDITVEGRPIKAVAQLTKQGFIFVLDRATGTPVWPIEERPVPKSDVPGEWTSPTQPFPTKPAAVELQGATEDDLVDFTPEIKAEALRVASQYRLRGLYTPSSLPKTPDGTLGTLSAPSAIGVSTGLAPSIRSTTCSMSRVSAPCTAQSSSTGGQGRACCITTRGAARAQGRRRRCSASRSLSLPTGVSWLST